MRTYTNYAKFCVTISMREDITNILDKVSEACNHYVASEELPKPFIGTSVRAIFLGADPGTSNDKKFRHVFELENKEESPYFQQFIPNLDSVKLSLDNLYVQNLCRNYFNCDTQSHRDHWLECAQYWVELLKKELDSLDPMNKLPILISAHIILESLCIKGCEKPEYYYVNRRFVRKDQNHLCRTLIPFFRGGRGKYLLTNWQEYSTKITKHVAQNFILQGK